MAVALAASAIPEGLPAIMTVTLALGVQRMARRREVQQQRVGERNLEKGLVLVFTGEGKGKTTAALGLVLRTLGHGEQVAVVQFIKGGDWKVGEKKLADHLGIEWHELGDGFTWERTDRVDALTSALGL